MSTLQRLKRDKSSGPFADSTDLLKDVFFVRAKSIDLLGDLLQLLYTKGAVPKVIKQYISANESVSFHKVLTNPNNIRPIGIRTAIEE